MHSLSDTGIVVYFLYEKLKHFSAISKCIVRFFEWGVLNLGKFLFDVDLLKSISEELQVCSYPLQTFNAIDDLLYRTVCECDMLKSKFVGRKAKHDHTMCKVKTG